MARPIAHCFPFITRPHPELLSYFPYPPGSGGIGHFFALAIWSFDQYFIYLPYQPCRLLLYFHIQFHCPYSYYIWGFAFTFSACAGIAPVIDDNRYIFIFSFGGCPVFCKE